MSPPTRRFIIECITRWLDPLADVPSHLLFVTDREARATDPPPDRSHKNVEEPDRTPDTDRMATGRGT